MRPRPPGSKSPEAPCLHCAPNLDIVIRQALQFGFLMRPLPHKGMNRQRCLRTMLAVFFAVFMFSDLCCMSSCAGELDELRGLGAARFTICSTGQPAPAVGTAGTGQQDDSKSENDDDGCFCSGHILQALPIDLICLDVASVVGDSQEASLPTSPPQTLFHPPRLS